MYYANLKYFDANPWQPRQAMDETALGELADNIRSLKDVRPQTRGLLQLPSARLIDDNGKLVPDRLWMLNKPGKDLSEWLDGCQYRLQLGIGHRRHAAFGRLEDGDLDYAIMPFELVDFSDEEMFKIALSENVARADLSPVEVARAMARYRDEFGRSSKEIGALFGMSDSAVRNLMRLLDLPEEALKALAEGRMSQGAGRALLSLYALPETFLKKHRSSFYYHGEVRRADNIVALAMSGGMASDVEEQINMLIRANAKEMSNTLWKHDAIFVEEAGIIHPDCKTCPARITRQNKHYCAVQDCFYTKQRVWERTYLEKASQAANLPIYEGNGIAQTTFEYSNEQVLVSAQTISCPNLCIRFDIDNYSFDRKDHQHCTIPKFPGAEIICRKMNQHCTCLKADRAGIHIARTFPPLPEIDEAYEANPVERTSEAAAPVTVDDLKDVNRVIREQKKQNQVEVAAIRDEVRRRLFLALSAFEMGAWNEVARAPRTGQKAAPDWSELVSDFAGMLVANEFEYVEGDNVTLNSMVANRCLKKMGMDELNGKLVPVSVETSEEALLTVDVSPILETVVHPADWLEV